MRSQAVGWLLLCGPGNLRKIGWQGQADDASLEALLPGPHAALRRLAGLDAPAVLSILTGTDHRPPHQALTT